MEVPRHETGSVCTTPLFVLAPGKSDTLQQTVRPRFFPGIYRFWDEVEWPLNGARITIVSNEFQIEQ